MPIVWPGQLLRPPTSSGIQDQLCDHPMTSEPPHWLPAAPPALPKPAWVTCCLDINPSPLKTHREAIRFDSDRAHTQVRKWSLTRDRQLSLQNSSYAPSMRYNQLGSKIGNHLQGRNKPPRAFFFFFISVTSPIWLQLVLYAFSCYLDLTRSTSVSAAPLIQPQR